MMNKYPKVLRLQFGVHSLYGTRLQSPGINIGHYSDSICDSNLLLLNDEAELDQALRNYPNLSEMGFRPVALENAR
jgi:hypothetical protein